MPTKLFEMDVAADTYEEAEAFAQKVAKANGVRIVQKIECGPGGGNPCFIMEGPADVIDKMAELVGQWWRFQGGAK